MVLDSSQRDSKRSTKDTTFLIYTLISQIHVLRTTYWTERTHEISHRTNDGCNQIKTTKSC